VSPVPQAAFLDVILYSREQLAAEYLAMPGGGAGPEGVPDLPDVPWGIIRCVRVVVDSV
jgi:hypothetical protein